MNMKRILLALACLAVLALSWAAVLSKPKDEDKQLELISKAEQLISKEIYDPAIPLLAEAAASDGSYKGDAEEKLKTVYLALIYSDTKNPSEYVRAYLALLDKQMNAESPQPAPFFEAVEFHQRQNDIGMVISVLRDGAEKTGDAELKKLYEANRYVWKLGREVYEEVTAFHNGSIQVRRNGLWGIATRSGGVVIPCQYDAVSTYDVDRAVVMQDGEIYAVNIKNNRVALLEKPALAIGNLAQNRIPLLKENGMWYFGDASLKTGAAEYEEIGMYSNNYAAVKVNGKWGVINSQGEFVLPAEYDDVIRDELGQCFMRDALFARKGETVYLYKRVKDALQEQTETYQDARPFLDSYAAVKKGGRWGFIDTSGTLVIPCQFEEALSFGRHLAAVKQDGLWGYASLEGEIVIEPIFHQAGTFYRGSAPVCTDEGWQFITLLEEIK